MHIVVLSGGLSPERDVSLRSGRRVAEALRASAPDWEISERDIDANLLDHLASITPECVIPLVHGSAGEDGAILDVLRCLQVAYVGSAPDSCRLAFDKTVAKALVRRAGLETPESISLPHSTFRELGAGGIITALVTKLSLPLMIKPTRGGSALGASVVHRAEDIPAALVGAFAYCDVALIERFIIGTEVAVGIIDTGAGPRALPAVEIQPDSGFYDYAARYTAGTTEFFVPARLDEATTEAAAQVAVAAHTALGLRDWSRADMIIDTHGVPWLLEVNVAPGMTETSLVPQALSAANIDMGDIMRELVNAAIARQ
ncbi:MAG: D-alanine--D-alanine ligase [Candidatus Nanopelagicales bacterium]